MHTNDQPHPSPDALWAQAAPGPVPPSDNGTGADRPAAHPIHQILEAARSGCKQVLPNLQALFNQYPRIWQMHGDLARACEQKWIDTICGNNLLAAEACRRVVEQKKRELAGPDPSPMEKLLAEEIVVDWLAAKQANLSAAGASSDGPAVAKLRLQRMDSAGRRVRDTCKTLGQVRQMTGGLKIELKHVNAPATAPAADSAPPAQPEQNSAETSGPAGRVRELLNDIESKMHTQPCAAGT